ncbi:MAG: hypothetical protein J3Q66DRAFT_397776 [Benniella sp.]|nr:MAG: hypothetical protein J3Q66DRAFT_397776 [Benniella sp.]
MVHRWSTQWDTAADKAIIHIDRALRTRQEPQGLGISLSWIAYNDKSLPRSKIIDRRRLICRIRRSSQETFTLYRSAECTTVRVIRFPYKTLQLLRIGTGRLAPVCAGASSKKRVEASLASKFGGIGSHNEDNSYWDVSSKFIYPSDRSLSHPVRPGEQYEGRTERCADAAHRAAPSGVELEYLDPRRAQAKERDDSTGSYQLKIIERDEGSGSEKIIEGLVGIEGGFAGAFNVMEATTTAYDKVITLARSGRSFMNSLKEGCSFDRKRDWYSVLGGADALIQDGKLATFKELVCKVPYRLQLPNGTRVSALEISQSNVGYGHYSKRNCHLRPTSQYQAVNPQHSHATGIITWGRFTVTCCTARGSTMRTGGEWE